MEARIWSFAAALAVLGLLLGLALATGDLEPWGAVSSSAVAASDGSAAGEPDPCPSPVRWRVAAVDPRLGLSPDQAGSAVDEAAALWERAAGRPLFAHDPIDGLPIRFVRAAPAVEGPEDPQVAASPRGVEAGAYRRLIEEGERGATVLGEEILVFRFDDRAGLVRILAHELGHALGFGHVDGRGAIMSAEYGREGGPPGPAVLAPEDLELVQTLSCS